MSSINTRLFTSDFLVKHREFCARKGDPRRIISDKGTQLVAASMSVSKKNLPGQAFNWDEIANDNSCTEWVFVPVGCQWRNQTEAMVKVMKRALRYSEW